jgi:PPOX class probable F420-dependent enzyme
MSTALKNTALLDLGKAQCIALTTFRMTGQAVTTPVWFAVSFGVIYVETHADAGKLKRLRHTTRVTFAPCAYSGNATGSASEGNARILTEPEERMVAATALAKRYGIMLGLYHVVSTARHMLQRQARIEPVYMAIEPISGRA